MPRQLGQEIAMEITKLASQRPKSASGSQPVLVGKSTFAGTFEGSRKNPTTQTRRLTNDTARPQAKFRDPNRSDNRCCPGVTVTPMKR